MVKKKASCEEFPHSVWRSRLPSSHKLVTQQILRHLCWVIHSQLADGMKEKGILGGGLLQVRPGRRIDLYHSVPWPGFRYEATHNYKGSWEMESGLRGKTIRLEDIEHSCPW